jgi:hypothetical protein
MLGNCAAALFSTSKGTGRVRPARPKKWSERGYEEGRHGSSLLSGGRHCVGRGGRAHRAMPTDALKMRWKSGAGSWSGLSSLHPPLCGAAFPDVPRGQPGGNGAWEHEEERMRGEDIIQRTGVTVHAAGVHLEGHLAIPQVPKRSSSSPTAAAAAGTARATAPWPMSSNPRAWQPCCSTC